MRLSQQAIKAREIADQQLIKVQKGASIGDKKDISLSPDLQFDLKDSISKTDSPAQTDNVSSNKNDT